MIQSNAPEPGIYPDVPDDVYHGWPLVSKSKFWRLNALLETCYTVEALRDAMAEERPDTDALIFGRAFDDFLFFPNRVAKSYAVGPTKTRGTKAWVAEEAEKPGVTLLTPEEIERIPCMVASILEHPIGNELLTGRGANQVSLVWDDDRTGLRTKARIDRFTAYRGMSTHIDIKTCRNLDWFHKDAADFGYMVQSAHYLHGCKMLDRLKGNPPQDRRFVFLVVEKTPHPSNRQRHRVGVYEYDALQLDSSLRIRDVLLARWKRFHERGEWPGDPPGIQHLTIPERIELAYGDMEYER